MAYDETTGRFTLPDDDSRVEEEKLSAQDYVARYMEDPCNCETAEGPHVHAPGAYPDAKGNFIGG